MTELTWSGLAKGESDPTFQGMQVHHLDPAFTTVERDRANLHLAIRIALGFVALLWLIQLSNWVLGLGPAELGIRPRELSGLLGVIFAPVLHGGPEHLLANTPPLLVAGATLSVPLSAFCGQRLAGRVSRSGHRGLGAGPARRCISERVDWSTDW